MCVGGGGRGGAGGGGGAKSAANSLTFNVSAIVAQSAKHTNGRQQGGRFRPTGTKLLFSLNLKEFFVPVLLSVSWSQCVPYWNTASSLTFLGHTRATETDLSENTLEISFSRQTHYVASAVINR